MKSAHILIIVLLSVTANLVNGVLVNPTKSVNGCSWNEHITSTTDGKVVTYGCKKCKDSFDGCSICSSATNCTSCMFYKTIKRDSKECKLNIQGIIFVVVCLILTLLTCIGFCIWKKRTKNITVKA